MYGGGLQGGHVSRQASGNREGRRVGEGPVGNVTVHTHRWCACDVHRHRWRFDVYRRGFCDAEIHGNVRVDVHRRCARHTHFELVNRHAEEPRRDSARVVNVQRRNVGESLHDLDPRGVEDRDGRQLTGRDANLDPAFHGGRGHRYIPLELQRRLIAGRRDRDQIRRVRLHRNKRIGREDGEHRVGKRRPVNAKGGTNSNLGNVLVDAGGDCGEFRLRVDTGGGSNDESDRRRE